MGQQTFELLNKHSGKLASINGATQIRAGVIGNMWWRINNI